MCHPGARGFVERRVQCPCGLVRRRAAGSIRAGLHVRLAPHRSAAAGAGSRAERLSHRPRDCHRPGGPARGHAAATLWHSASSRQAACGCAPRRQRPHAGAHGAAAPACLCACLPLVALAVGWPGTYPTCPLRLLLPPPPPPRLPRCTGCRGRASPRATPLHAARQPAQSSPSPSPSTPQR